MRKALPISRQPITIDAYSLDIIAEQDTSAETITDVEQPGIIDDDDDTETDQELEQPRNTDDDALREWTDGPELNCGWRILFGCTAAASLYGFLISLKILGTGLKLIGGKSSAKLFEVSNPLTGVVYGIFATLLMQSSSTTTSLIVSAVGAGELSKSNAAAMIMGANIGTTVTNTLVTLLKIKDREAYRRGFAGATIHDIFNFLAVATILPFQWGFNFLIRLTELITKNYSPSDNSASKFTNPISLIVSPVSKAVANIDKKVLKAIAEGKCDNHANDINSTILNNSFYNISGINNTIPLYANSTIPYNTSVINNTLAKYHNSTLPYNTSAINNTSSSNASSFDCDQPLLKGGLMRIMSMSDVAAGATCTAAGIILALFSLFFVVKSLRKVLSGNTSKIIKKAISLNPYLTIVIGCLLTIGVQSSSITTSLLVPLVADGLISLEEMFPLTLGANIGTTVTALLAASMATSHQKEALQIALAHVFFNLIGTTLFFPVPKVRNLILNGAKKLGDAAGKNRAFPIIYTATAFVVVPAACLGAAELTERVIIPKLK